MSAFKFLNIGDSGTGKTHSLKTALEAGFNLRLLSVESNSLPVFEKVLALHKKDIAAKKFPELIPGQVGVMCPAKPKKSFKDAMLGQEANLGKSLDSLMKTQDSKRKEYTRFLEVWKSAVNFIDLFTGEDFGSVDSWGEDTVFAIDSLTILCEAIVYHTIGGKVATSQPEWGIMQKTLIEFLRMMTDDTACNLILMAHPTREIDPTLGVTRIYPSNLGQALNPLIPGMFTEVVWSYKDSKGQYKWSTDDKLCTTRYINLPCSKDIPQDFKLLKGK